MTEPVLAIAWVVLAHLVADFVLQNDWIAMNKGRGHRTGWAALLVHGGHVGLCLLPAILVFGWPGLGYVAVIVVSHMVIDRWKVRATRRAEARAQDDARRWIASGRPATVTGLGAAWTPTPGLLFLADQVLHLTFAIVGWLVLLSGVTVTGPFTDFANAVLRDWDRTAVHAAVLTGVILVSLFIANTRGAFFFVLSLTSPRDVVPAPDAPGPAATPAATAAPVGAALRIDTTVAILERLLTVALILAGAPLLVGFLIVADTLARARQLDSRGAIEYYLLSTLASLSVAIGTGLLAAAALRTVARV